MPKELTTAFEIGDEIKVSFGLETELQADQEGTGSASSLDQQGDLFLSDRVLYFFFADDLFFGEDFHGVDAMSVFFADLEDLSKGATADEFEELEGCGCELRGRVFWGIVGVGDLDAKGSCDIF